MITDAILNVFYLILHGLLLLLPIPPANLSEGMWIGNNSSSAGMRWFMTANYYLPIAELFVWLGVLALVGAAIIVYRFVIRLIP